MPDLIHKVFLDSDHAREEIREPALRTRVLAALFVHSYYGFSLASGNGGVVNCRGGGHPERPPRETALAKKVALGEDREDCPFATTGCNRDFHIAILDVEHGVSRIALLKDGLLIALLPRCFVLADLLQKVLCSEVESIFADHKYPPEP
jgi:hypothetical protein